ncbi:MAG: hypothetical protein IT343_25015 [Candidatus Melainabacteria bacterium]|jgi:hypothetical protein|nr:hypothetical protein [Candidatus Melainabacteria bacterium]
MADEVEQNLDAPKIQQPTDAAKQDGVITGQPNQEVHGKAFATAHKDDKYPSGIMPALHESFGIEGDLTPADTGKKPADLRIAVRDDYLDRSEYKRESEVERHARVMAGHYAAGETVAHFAQRPGATDAMSASPIFTHAIKELNNCAWGNAIRIWRGHPTEITDYSAEYNLMELDSKDGARRQVEVFSHEAYHATHQDLDKLFGKNGAVTPQEFINIKMQQEAGAFLQEIKTNEELHSSRPTPLHAGDDPNKHIEYMWVDRANPKGEPQKQDMNSLLVRDNGKINEEASLEKLETFLRAHPAAIKDRNGGYTKDSSGNYAMNDYVLHYGNAHGSYKEEFNNNRSRLIKLGYIQD